MKCVICGADDGACMSPGYAAARKVEEEARERAEAAAKAAKASSGPSPADSRSGVGSRVVRP
jgi:hypothetical protein